MCDSSYLMLKYFKIKTKKTKKQSNSSPRIRNISSEETVIIFNINKSVKTLTYNDSFTRVTSFTCAD